MKYHEHIDDEIKFIANELATHSFQKHVIEQKEFGARERNQHNINGQLIKSASGQATKVIDRDLNITTKEDMTAYITSFLKDPQTKAIALKNNHQSIALYNKRDNALAIIDTNGENLGTFYRPSKGIAKFQDLIMSAKNSRESAPIFDGGYIGLREHRAKKHLFKDPNTQQSLLQFLKKNGRTTTPTAIDVGTSYHQK